MYRLIVVCVLLIVGGALSGVQAFADTCSSVRCNNVEVDVLYVDRSKHTYIGVDGDMSALDCTPVSGVYIYLAPESAAYDQIYSLLLSAKMTNRKVNFRMVGGNGVCEASYITITE